MSVEWRDRESRDTTSDLYVTLRCTTTTARGQNRQEKVKIPSLYCTVSDLKQKIQSLFNIPVCVQSIQWQGVILNNETRLYDHGITSDDHLTVTYYGECDCRDVIDSVQWLGNLLNEIMEKGLPLIENNIQIDYLDTELQDAHLEDLSFQLFHPWQSPNKYLNKLLFKDLGGLDKLCELYAKILHYSWDKTSLELKFCEVRILEVLWNFGETFPLRRHMFNHGVLDMTLKSLVRKPVQRYTLFCDDSTSHHQIPPHLVHRSLWLLTDVVSSSLGCICNLSELDECRLLLATNSEALSQMVEVALCPTFRGHAATCAVVTFMNLANMDETHIYLAKDEYIEGLLQCHRAPRNWTPDEDEDRDSMLIEYGVLLFLAQLILISPSLLSVRLLPTIAKQFNTFLQKADPVKLCQAETENEYIWYSFLPFLRLLYHPNINHTESLLDKLHKQSTELSVIALHNMLGRANHRDVLKHEQLLDYVTCLPWHTTGQVFTRSQAFVKMIQNAPDIQLQVPSLLNIAKATVAKHYCGLRLVIQMSPPELFAKIYASYYNYR